MARKPRRARRSRAGSRREMPVGRRTRIIATVRRPAETFGRAGLARNADHRAPNAAAMWSGPESWPTNSVASESAAAVSATSRRRRDRRRSPADAYTTDAARRAHASCRPTAPSFRATPARRRAASIRRAARSGRARRRTDEAPRTASAAVEPRRCEGPSRSASRR